MEGLAFIESTQSGITVIYQKSRRIQKTFKRFPLYIRELSLIVAAIMRSLKHNKNYHKMT